MAIFTYFAYGSNMLTERLQERCSSAWPIGPALARGYSLSFCKRSDKDGSGKAALLREDTPGAEVYGVLFEIDEDERPKLDSVEGMGRGYERDDAFRVVRDGEEIAATTYLMSPSHRDDSLKPFDWYHALVIAGTLQHGLPKSYIEMLRTMEAQTDPNPKRNKDAWRTLQRAGYEHLLERRS